MDNKQMLKHLDKMVRSFNVALNAQRDVMNYPGKPKGKDAYVRLEKHMEIVENAYNTLREALE